jgi:hypothetical protein
MTPQVGRDSSFVPSDRVTTTVHITYGLKNCVYLVVYYDTIKRELNRKHMKVSV